MAHDNAWQLGGVGGKICESLVLEVSVFRRACLGVMAWSLSVEERSKARERQGHEVPKFWCDARSGMPSWRSTKTEVAPSQSMSYLDLLELVCRG